MAGKFIASAQIHINAPREKVWEALTTPEIIKKYFFGTNAISDWKAGSPLLFRGEWQGKTYEDKGTILASDKPRLFSYSYWSSMSGIEDKPENYVDVVYRLEESGKGTDLTVTQSNVPSEEMKDHSEQNWKMVLEGLKKVVEA